MPYSMPPGSLRSRPSGSARGGRIKERVKSLTYSATDNKLLLAVDTLLTEGSVKTDVVGDIEIINSGNKPAFAILAYRLWSDATTMTATTYHINHLLKPGESLSVPDSPVVISDETVEQLAGTAVTNATPNANMYTDSTANVDDGSGLDIIGSASETKLFLEPHTSETNCTANLFRVGDRIRVNNEIMEVTAIGDKSDLANNYLTVIRGVDGSTAVDTHADTAAIRFPFYNNYHDFDKFSVAQTDSKGFFKCYNFMGQGRALTGVQGITPGSVAIKFFTQGAYQSLGLQNISSNSKTGLALSTEYGFDITVDGSGLLTSDYMKFTTDTTNDRFGGATGLLQKINEVFAEQYYTTSSAIFEERVSVGIENGDIIFRSNSNLSSSAILLAAPSAGETTPFGVGRFPAIGSVNAPVAARLLDDTLYDPITYSSYPNEGAFCYDDGYGRLRGPMCTGSVNYETGALDFKGPNSAEFVVTCLHTSAFSGKQNATDTAKMNTLKAIYGNMPNQKGDGQLTIIRR